MTLTEPERRLLTEAIALCDRIRDEQQELYGRRWFGNHIAEREPLCEEYQNASSAARELRNLLDAWS